MTCILITYDNAGQDFVFLIVFQPLKLLQGIEGVFSGIQWIQQCLVLSCPAFIMISRIPFLQACRIQQHDFT